MREGGNAARGDTVITGKHEDLTLRHRRHGILQARRKPTRELLETTERAGRFRELQLACTRGCLNREVDRR